MIRKTESANTKKVMKELDKYERKYFTIKGSAYGSDNGTPDMFTLDDTGRFVGLELKSSVGEPSFNQFKQGYQILKSGGRFIVGYGDFTVEAMDNQTIPKVTYVDNRMKIPKATTEIVLDHQ